MSQPELNGLHLDGTNVVAAKEKLEEDLAGVGNRKDETFEDAFRYSNGEVEARERIRLELEVAKPRTA